MRSLFKFFSSLRLTVTLLAFSMVLVWLATFEQVQWGVFEVQKRYFEAFFAIWTYPAQWPGADSLTWLHIPLPGGFLLGGLLLINLVCSHFRFFRASWRKTGIVLIHTGILALIVSGFLTAYWQEEYFTWINVGAQANYIESFHDVDLVFIDHTDPKTDTLVSIPTSLLDPAKPISNLALPFTVKTVFFYPNSTFGMRSENPSLPELPSDHGVGSNHDLAVAPTPYNYSDETTNLATVVVSLDTPQGTLGKWLASTWFDPKTIAPFLATKLPQTFTVGGHTWEITLRPRREYLPYTLRLDKFTHDLYPGTDVPKRFESEVRLTNAAKGEDRPVLIYMNHPLRYDGLTFYQASFARGDSASMFQVVRNPGAPLPYIAVLLVGIGMLLHFILIFLQHLRRQKESVAANTGQGGKPRE